MKFQLDHDYHIHSCLSSCSSDPAQNTARILSYGEQNGYRALCLTDHYWDERVSGASGWYAPQNTAHIMESLPLPQGEKTRFFFGCETDMDKYFRIGISPETMEKLDFIIIPTTHLHMTGFTIDEKDDAVERRAELYAQRLDRLMDMDLPFEKVGVAHLTCGLMAKNRPEDDPRVKRHLQVLNCISDAELTELYTKMAKKGVGFELNFSLSNYETDEYEQVLRPYRIAKNVGCKFYIGSDAHHNPELDGAFDRFSAIIDALDLQESDKFTPPFAKF